MTSRSIVESVCCWIQAVPPGCLDAAEVTLSSAMSISVNE